MEFVHKPVLLKEVIEGLAIKPDGTYLDGTVGGAGHSLEIVKRLDDRGHLFCTDQDAEAIEAASQRLGPYENRTDIIRTNFENALTAVAGYGTHEFDGILLDLGVSSHQFDDPDRGFSYRYDSRLDMRMDRDAELTAADIINRYPREEIARILKVYGEEQFASNIASHIVRIREDHPITTTGELSEIIHAAIPARMRGRGGNPCKKTFQALRIECNRELDVLKDSLDGFIEALKPGGRLCVISFHSLEDRIVKENFRKNENPCVCPPSFPVCTCGAVSKGKAVTRKPITASEEELKDNPRSSSAKLRVFERSAGK